jgi:hypothetical protein
VHDCYEVYNKSNDAATVVYIDYVHLGTIPALSRDELRQLEQQLNRVGKQAESLFDRRVAKVRSGK